MKDKICEHGFDYLKQLAEALLPGDRKGKALIKIAKANHPNDIEACFTEFVEKWSQSEVESTWQKLINALRDTDKNALASEVEKSLLPSHDQLQLLDGKLVILLYK